jgi:hypothetical protein
MFFYEKHINQGIIHSHPKVPQIARIVNLSPLSNIAQNPLPMTQKVKKQKWHISRLGWKDSNLHSTAPKTVALPLGHNPVPLVAGSMFIIHPLGGDFVQYHSANGGRE